MMNSFSLAIADQVSPIDQANVFIGGTRIEVWETGRFGRFHL